MERINKLPKYMRVNLTNRRFGLLMALEPTNKRQHDGSIVWRCACDCGNKKLVSSKLLLGNSTKSCGCRKTYKIDENRLVKKCSKCRKIKKIDDFYKNKWAKDGHGQYCKSCSSIVNKNNNAKYRDRVNKYSNKKYRENLDFRILHGMRNRVRLALLNNSKACKTTELLGCSIKQLRKFLSSKFTSKMSWENYGKYWEIDHIKPCCLFDLIKPEEQRKCFHYTNLQPLSAKENRIKGDYYNE